MENQLYKINKVLISLMFSYKHVLSQMSLGEVLSLLIFPAFYSYLDTQFF
jgi:hypothetical protein